MISRFLQVLVFFVCMCGYAFSQTASSYYVKVADDKDIETAVKILSERFPNTQVTQPFARNTFEHLNRVIRLDGSDIYADDLTKAITFPIEYIEQVPIGKIAYTPNDMGVEFGSPNQWYLYKISAEGAWNYSTGNANIAIAVVDNGFLSDHPDLVNKIRINSNEIPDDGIDNDNNGYIDDYAGWNARNNNGDVYITSSNTSHGTHVAGIAAAQTDNSVGGASLAFLTQWLPIKAADNNDNITHGYEGISFAAERGAKVINCSWGSLDSSSTAKSVINFALAQHCFVVASAGNFANETPTYPATYAGVISVASTTQSDVKLNTSSFGPRVNISAPGSGIWSTIATATAAPSYGFMSGTSMASPITAGLLGLMSGYAPAGNDSVILNCLYATAVDIYGIQGNSAYQGMLGKGRLEAESAMQCLNETLHLGISENHSSYLLGVYPNPTADWFYLLSLTGDNTLSSTFSWTLKDVSGKEIAYGKEAQGDISSLTSSIYFLTVENKGNNQFTTLKLIKK